MGLVKFNRESNMAIYRVEGPDEIASYRALMLEGMPTCPKCEKPMEVKDVNLLVFVSDPATPSIFGCTVGEMRVKCENCGAILSVRDKVNPDSNVMPDVASWPSIGKHVQKLQEAKMAAMRATMPVREERID